MGITEDENAQFMLLAGFIIAIGLVIATALLSNIIFESNMAGESGADPLKYDIANLVHIMADEMKSAYRNANGVDNTAKINNFGREMQNFNANLSKMYAVRGEGVNLNLNVSNWNDSRYANFTENGMPGGAANWTLIENVKDSNITVNVTGITPPFNISIINSTKSWQINFTAAPENRTITNSQIIANVTQPYTISFINGQNAAGRFNITGNTNNGRAFTRARDYVLNTTLTLSTSRMRANLTIPVPVPW